MMAGERGQLGDFRGQDEKDGKDGEHSEICSGVWTDELASGAVTSTPSIWSAILGWLNAGECGGMLESCYLG